MGAVFQKSETSPFFRSRWWSQNQSQTRLIYRAGTIEIAGSLFAVFRRYTTTTESSLP
jgi:hypothetical protein